MLPLIGEGAQIIQIQNKLWRPQLADKADAYLGKNSKGKMAVTKIVLHPVVTFSGEFTISNQDMKDMHDRSHRYCFVANSLADEVIFEVSL